MAENMIPSHVQIEEKCRKFLTLLEEREVGVMAWLEMRTKLARELYEALGAVLGDGHVTFKTKGVFPDEKEIAKVWVESDKLHIKMLLNNGFDVVFESPEVLRPRCIIPFAPELGTEAAMTASELSRQVMARIGKIDTEKNQFALVLEAPNIIMDALASARVDAYQKGLEKGLEVARRVSEGKAS